MDLERVDFLLSEIERNVLELDEDGIVMVPNLSKETIIKLKANLYRKYEVWVEPPIYQVNNQRNCSDRILEYTLYVAKKEENA
ncbi:MAG: hypothetical protein KatS3mg001_577 [Candidatus Pacearchaeota archaeon]|nr:MAG: hypothetical protein KatS3mg001_577 [Candidatus Pacearchaeota archaeon]